MAQEGDTILLANAAVHVGEFVAKLQHCQAASSGAQLEGRAGIPHSASCGSDLQPSIRTYRITHIF